MSSSEKIAQPIRKPDTMDPTISSSTTTSDARWPGGRSL